MAETKTPARVATPVRPIRSVGIVGGGPAGAALATHLARAGLEIALFQRDQRPPLLIGESLVPAVVPFLRDLGVEQEVAAYSTWKPGATFTLAPGDAMSFRFADVPNAVTAYAYNVPRDRFDATLLAAARRAGARVVDRTATVQREAGGSERLRLSEESVAAAGFARQPDLVVDASGRTRLVAGLLGLPFRAGARRDTALFAHCENVPLRDAGHVHSDRMAHGWCWRIPLPGRVSVGIVVPSEVLRGFGDGLETRFDRYLAEDALVGHWGADVKRGTRVLRYDNYQLTTLRGFGPNWALVGDAFGFVDPVFSSGLLVGLDAADRLARTILRGTPRAFLRYQRHVIAHLDAWQRVVDRWYDGRLFTLFRVGELVRHTPVGRIMDWHFRRHLPRVFTGEATRRPYSRSLLQFMARHALAGNDPDELAIR